MNTTSRISRTVAAGAALLCVLGGARAQQAYASNVAAPELVGGSWLNTPGNSPLTLKGLQGKVTIVHFWTFACINCRHNLPIYARWQRQFTGKDVALIRVHTPETEEEKNWANVAREVKRLGIMYPVLIDANGANWNRWRQQFWPTVYLIDKHGHARYRWEGELAYNGADGEARMARRVEALLREK